MKIIKLNDDTKIPVLCYGSAIINNNPNKKIKFYLKKLLYCIKFNKAELKKEKGLVKILNYMSKSNQINSIDTSRAYGYSEEFIGKIINKNRKQYYIIDKIMNKDQYEGNIEKAVKESLQKLNTSYIDLLLLHWPVKGKYKESWKELEKIKDEGLVKSIGVSNFNIHHLEELKKVAKYMPVVNEIECHPLFTQDELRKYCRENSIQILAYTSTARMDERLKKTCLVPISKKYNKTLPQIILRWHYQIGNIPIFNTSNVDRFVENMNIFDFELTDEEISKITKININSRLRYDPDNCDFHQL